MLKNINTRTFERGSKLKDLKGKQYRVGRGKTGHLGLNRSPIKFLIGTDFGKFFKCNIK